MPSVLEFLRLAGIFWCMVKFCMTVDGILSRVIELPVKTPVVGAFTVLVPPVILATLS